jgi:HSP20 family protein
MSNVVIHKKADRPVAANPEPSRDPLRVMRAFLSWDPFREMVPSLAIDDDRALGFAPAFDVKETPDAFVFRADLPGVGEADLEVTLTGNRLTISGKREQENEDRSDRYYAYERSYGTFSRSFTLPDGVDGENLRASLQNGVLEVTVPKKPEVQPKKIDVKSSSATPTSSESQSPSVTPTSSGSQSPPATPTSSGPKT